MFHNHLLPGKELTEHCHFLWLLETGLRDMPLGQLSAVTFELVFPSFEEMVLVPYQLLCQCSSPK